MHTYRINLDHESYLFDPRFDIQSPSTIKKNREFEYVFFLINKLPSCLKNVRSYSIGYLSHLRKLGFFIPELSPEATEASDWWGHGADFELSKKLNSKLTSIKIAQENNWGFWNGCLVRDEASLLNHISLHPKVLKWILKGPHGFSGIGHYSFLSDAIKNGSFKYKFNDIMLLEPCYERVFDIGTTFILNDGKMIDWFMVENYNSPSGSFRGGAGAVDKMLFRNFIYKKYGYDLSSLENVTSQIAEKYQHLGARDNIQVDSFVYLENGELKLYPLVEVNYRKTMGLVIYSIAEKLGENKMIEWLIYNQKEALNIELGNLIRLSPEDNHFLSYYKKFI